jgi:RimJ/RimL family protein N-acetyltransferase
MTHYLTTPNGNVTIRVATVDDAPHLLALRLEALTIHPEAFAADIDKTAEAGENAWVEQITENTCTESGSIVIACTANEVIGMTGIVRGHWPKTRHSGMLWGVYVSPNWRGYKIGAAIVNGCVEWGATHNLTVVTLGVTNSNLPAICCYTACGFKEYGVVRRAILYNSNYYDELLMYKLI